MATLAVLKIWERLVARAARSSPVLICLTGVDGSGKSTQIQLLTARLQSEGYTVATVWTGGKHYLTRAAIRLVQRKLGAPVLTKDGGRHFKENPRFSGSVKEQWDAYTQGSSSIAQRQPMLSWLWTHVSLFEHALEAMFNVLPHQLQGRIVISDRYLYRSLVNRAILLGQRPEEMRPLLHHLAFRIAPRPTLYLLLDISLESALARKQDIPAAEHIARRIPLYRWLAMETGMPVVDASRSVDEVAAAIWSVVAPVIGDQRREPND